MAMISDVYMWNVQSLSIQLIQLNYYNFPQKKMFLFICSICFLSGQFGNECKMVFVYQYLVSICRSYHYYWLNLTLMFATRFFIS